MPFNIHEYHPKWKLIRKLIKENRAKGKCEHCDLEHNSYAMRGGFSPAPTFLVERMHALVKDGFKEFEARKMVGIAKVVLTVAHLDHDITNNRFDNLKCLCQRCHLQHDKADNWNRRRYGKDYKKNQETLLFIASQKEKQGKVVKTQPTHHYA